MTRDQASPCAHCEQRAPLAFDFTMAFQPIVRIFSESIYAHEALVRGPNNQGAGWVLAQVTDDNRYQFDQACRTKAIELAAKLAMPGRLSINFLPRAIYDPASCIKKTIQAAQKYGVALHRLIFELTENEQLDQTDHIRHIVDFYHDTGFTMAIDDFGTGYSGIELLSELPVDIVKLDRSLIDHIDQAPRKQVIVSNLQRMITDLGSELLAEGIERREEALWLADHGLDLQQGFLFAKPAFESLPEVHFPTR